MKLAYLEKFLFRDRKQSSRSSLSSCGVNNALMLVPELSTWKSVTHEDDLLRYDRDYCPKSKYMFMNLFAMHGLTSTRSEAYPREVDTIHKVNRCPNGGTFIYIAIKTTELGIISDFHSNED